MVNICRLEHIEECVIPPSAQNLASSTISDYELSDLYDSTDNSSLPTLGSISHKEENGVHVARTGSKNINEKDEIKEIAFMTFPCWGLHSSPSGPV